MLVTGGTGAIGPSVVGALMDAGCVVRVLANDVQPDHVCGDRTETIVGDITDDDCVRRAMEGVDYVIHMAALSSDFAAGDDCNRVNVYGTSHCRRGSSMYCFGPVRVGYHRFHGSGVEPHVYRPARS